MCRILNRVVCLLSVLRDTSVPIVTETTYETRHMCRDLFKTAPSLCKQIEEGRFFSQQFTRHYHEYITWYIPL